MDNLYELLLESCTIHAHSVGFPELVLPAVVQVLRLHLHIAVAHVSVMFSTILTLDTCTY